MRRPVRSLTRVTRVQGVHAEGEQAEVDRHDLDDRALAAEGGADPRPDGRRLGQRRVPDPVLAELREQALGDREAAAVAADVLAHEEHGLGPRYAVVLEVPGRRSGLVRRTTLVRVELGGARYLVSLSGESEWVRNVRAAGGRVVLGWRRRLAAVLVEVAPAERPAVIRAYLGRAGGTGRSWGAANEARYYFVAADPSGQELAAVADRYRVFRIVEPAAPRGGRPVLADEQRAGRLQISPIMIAGGGGDGRHAQEHHRHRHRVRKSPTPLRTLLRAR